MNDSLLYFEHARNLFDEADQVDEPGSTEAQHLMLNGIGRALLAVVEELRRSNEDRDRFYTELLGFFSKLTEEPQPGPDGSLRSGQPAAAPDGQEGGEGD